MKQIVFTKKEVQELSGVSVNVVSNIINQLVDLNVIIPESTVVKKDTVIKNGKPLIVKGKRQWNIK